MAGNLPTVRIWSDDMSFEDYCRLEGLETIGEHDLGFELELHDPRGEWQPGLEETGE